jgi:ornithine carrier protein
MAENAVLFLAYNQIQQTIKSFRGGKKELSIGDLCLAGGLSGALVSFVLTPVELLKCRLQTQGYLAVGGSQKLRGPLAVLYDTLASRGVSGLYSGHSGTFLREVAGGVAWFGVYELAVKKMIENTPHARGKNDLSPWQLMGAGALAGMGYNAALYPADVVKSRMQSGLHGHDGFFKVTRDIYSTYGSRFFFRGFGLTVCRSAPSSGVIFFTYEWLSRTFGSAN